MVHHFGHYGAAEERACRSGPETALHRFAKELLASRLALVLPPLERGGEGRRSYTGGPYRFDAAALERRLGAITPDVIVWRADRDLLVEFCVTHRCDADKIAKIASLGIAAVEIDLSSVALSTSRPALEEAILNQAPRRWLHNSKLSPTPSAVPKPELRRSASHWEQSMAALERVYLSAYREVQAMRSRSLDTNRIQADSLSHAIGVEIAGLGCFNVAPADWQAAILLSALDRALSGRPGFVSTKGALQQLRERGWLHKRFSRLSAAEVTALEGALPSFAPPAAGIAAWAMALSRQGILVPSSVRDQWVIRRETLQLVREARQHGSTSATVATTPQGPPASRS
ncbi:hypothetical protein OCOJLMKI_1978 [Methylobacterium iners]|uniref:Uncharacterized protein n=2 Tax=Methylobacterium iners TaxID=418707 RepID=A0ABQ4RX11_9HYPH|nr:hypothetical protein OCOJLMKI_1978 [Methylobacterium iners]